MSHRLLSIYIFAEDTLNEKDIWLCMSLLQNIWLEKETIYPLFIDRDSFELAGYIPYEGPCVDRDVRVVADVFKYGYA
jgi:hypothetical protein